MYRHENFLQYIATIVYSGLSFNNKTRLQNFSFFILVNKRYEDLNFDWLKCVREYFKSLKLRELISYEVLFVSLDS